MQARRHAFWLFFLTGTLFGLAGCHQANLIDSPLFLPNQENADKKAALTKPDGIQQASATETIPTKFPPAGTTPATTSANALKELTLGPLTGGFDGDNQPGDEALLIELQPRDSANKIVSVRGNVQVTALQISPEGVKSILCVWDIKADALQTHWKLNSGYFLLLPWRGWPAHEQLRVVVKMTVPNGKTYEVDKDVRVHLAAARPAPPPNPAAAGEGEP